MQSITPPICSGQIAPAEELWTRAADRLSAAAAELLDVLDADDHPDLAAASWLWVAICAGGLADAESAFLEALSASIRREYV